MNFTMSNSYCLPQKDGKLFLSTFQILMTTHENSAYGASTLYRFNFLSFHYITRIPLLKCDNGESLALACLSKRKQGNWETVQTG